MKLTPVEQVRKGFWFVRRINSDYPWGIAIVRGEFPFLTGITIAYADDVNGLNMDRIMGRQYFDITNPNEWEFGPRIEFPSEAIDENKL